ncbi:MAG TPA: MscL family protein [Candidatus Saccharimonadales bacterium]|nr:MscL family protein [Candidatus Saccharimonadales bacterium]
MEDQISEPPKAKKVKQISSHLREGKTSKTIKGFSEFFRRQGVVGLAIGIFLGSDAKTVVDALTNNIINPMVGIVTGNVNLSNESICIKTVRGVCQSKIGWGNLVSTLISFVIAIIVIYVIVKAFKLDHFDKKD